MNLKLSTLLAVALAGGALLAGCGSSETKSTPSTASTPPGPVAPANPQQAVANCKKAIQKQPIAATAKAKLDKICEKAATTNSSGLHALAKQVCVELVNASHLPPGAARVRALSVCNVK
jgi:hypothetical protein